MTGPTNVRLCLDIGNSRVKIGLYAPLASDPDHWVLQHSRKGISAAKLTELIGRHRLQAAIVSSTRDYDPEVRGQLEQLPDFIELDHHTQLPVTNHYKTPETLGKDRIAAICGAYALFPGRQVLVIDAGTCITMDYLSASGIYPGGSIHPGINMRYRALNNYTGKLPLVKMNDNAGLTGNSTEKAIVSGVQYAVVREIEGMIEAYVEEYGELKVIITGGDAPFFVSRLKSGIFAHPNLVLAGLRKILDDNVEGP